MNLKDKSCSICILARDCEKGCRHNISKIEELRSYFGNSYVVLIENDSKDCTKDLLLKWKDESTNIYLCSEDTNQVTIPKASQKCLYPGTSCTRIEKMASFRNRYLDILINNNITTDYIIVIDIDLDDFSVEGIIDSIINAPRDWTGLFAYGVQYWNIGKIIFFKKYYDNYAYVPENSESLAFTYEQRLKNIDSIERKFRFGTRYFPCISAFGGIGIYKYENLITKRYKCEKNLISLTDEAICEHISVNTGSNEKNYICKNMKALYERYKFKPYIIFSNTTYIKLWKIIHRRDFRQ